MRVLQVCPTYYPNIGGVETHVQQISEHLKNEGFDVTVLTSTTSKQPLKAMENINNVPVRRFQSWAPNNAYFFSSGINNFLKENSKNFDIVHAHNYHALPALYAAQHKESNRLFFTAHYHGYGSTPIRSFFHKPYKRYGKMIFEKADNIICVSKFEQDLILKNFKIKRTCVIPNGVDLAEFQGLNKQKKDHEVLLFVGRLEKYKGVERIIEALSVLDSNVLLRVIGKGPFKQDLTKLSQKLHVGSRVTFLNDLPRNKLVQEYSNADIFILLSQRESYGICVAEALAAGTPCIVACGSALSEWVDDKNVFGVEPSADKEELALRINEAIKKTVKDPPLLDWREVTQKLIALYNQEIE